MWGSEVWVGFQVATVFNPTKLRLSCFELRWVLTITFKGAGGDRPVQWMVGEHPHPYYGPPTTL